MILLASPPTALQWFGKASPTTNPWVISKNPQGAQLHTANGVGWNSAYLAESSQRDTVADTSGAWENTGLALPYLPLD